MPRIYLSPPHPAGGEVALIEEAFASNWLAPVGPHLDAFEREFAAFIGVPHAVALSSGTAALHLAVRLAGVGPGDEVLCSDLTFIATANAIVYERGTPVFIDADAATWTMDPVLLGEELAALARRAALPRAVVVTDLYGRVADYDSILRICAEYGVTVIEDAAEALGATRWGRSAGSFGAFGAFSFNGNKIVTTAGGGMLISHDGQAIATAKYLASQARDPVPHYEHSAVGYNYRLSNILAAIGRAQLQVLEARVAARRRNFDFYCHALADLPGLAFMPETADGGSTRWLTCLTIDPAEFGATRDEVRLALEADDIESRPVWKPMHLQPVYRHLRVRGGRVSAQLFERGLCLPSGSTLSPDDLARVTDVVRRQCRSASWHPFRGARPLTVLERAVSSQDHPASEAPPVAPAWLLDAAGPLASSNPAERHVKGTRPSTLLGAHELLRREPARFDHALVERLITGKRVMVTGAGGSIGAELARQAMRYGPATLVLVDRAEPALFAIESELTRDAPTMQLTALVADVGDEARLRQVFLAEHPQIVLHAAAHKHVALMERNPAEAIKNNVLATCLLGGLAGEFDVETFVLISTDKAVKAASVMGASKRMAELVMHDLHRRFPQGRYLAVRFGNVIGSAGSVVPIFREQIVRGGPVTVTHPDATRYFMTIDEAAQLVLEAGAVGRGGEVLILDMGEPVKILDLAKQMIRVAGLDPYSDVPIVFIGLRPGEKLHEELHAEGEQMAVTPHSRIRRVRLPSRPRRAMQRSIARLAALASGGCDDAIRTFLNEFLGDSSLSTPSAPALDARSVPQAGVGGQ